MSFLFLNLAGIKVLGLVFPVGATVVDGKGKKLIFRVSR